MTFSNETEAIKQLSDLIIKAGATLFKATKYVYALSAESFYTCDVKDLFKVVLNNVYDADKLGAFHISIGGDSCGQLNSREFFKVYRLMIYSFAVRLPVLCRAGAGEEEMAEKQIRAVYDLVIEKGVANFDDAVTESFSDMMNKVKKRKPIPPYSPEWFRSYIYGAVPDITDITNRNFFFLGAVDVLFVLFYYRLEEEYSKSIKALCL